MKRATRKQMLEALAFMYQYAGATGARVEVLDNLSALANDEPPIHDWPYPASPAIPRPEPK